MLCTDSMAGAVKSALKPYQVTAAREMGNPERADREALMEVYGYRNKGVLGVIRLYCRQGYGLVLNRLAGIAPPPGLRVALQRARGVKIGKHVYLGFDADIDNLHPHLITIEDHVTIGHRVMIFTHRNPGLSTEIKEKYFPPFVAPTTIKRGAWVTTGSIVLAGVTVGEVSVVGGRSVVRRDVEPYTVVVGNPARMVRRLERETDTRGSLERSGRPTRRVGYEQLGHKGVEVEDGRGGAQ